MLSDSREKSAITDFSFEIGSSCLKGVKYIFLVFNSCPIFFADPPRASFVAIDKMTGRLFLRWAFTAIVTDESVIPFASLPSVLPISLHQMASRYICSMHCVLYQCSASLFVSSACTLVL